MNRYPISINRTRPHPQRYHRERYARRLAWWFLLAMAGIAISRFI